MKYWRDRTNKLLNSKKFYGGGWGGADQQVLGEILGTKDINRMRKIITVNKLKFKGLRFKGFPCKTLNNILHPDPEDKSVHIIHYKGSWRYVLSTGKWDHPLRKKDVNGVKLYNLWYEKLNKFKHT